MKLRFDSASPHCQPDPFIFEDGGRYYLYATAGLGVEAYSADSPFGLWTFEGIVATVPQGRNYWAPCILRRGGDYFLYVSCDTPDHFQCLHVIPGRGPLGPFGGARRLFDTFSIDAHAVETPAGLFLWYAADNLAPDNGRIGTRVFVDRLLDPFTPARRPREAIVPTFDEEIFQRNRLGDGRDWHTIEGPFWFRDGAWQYVMYSGGCFENDTYHIGYAAAKSDEPDLTKVAFTRHTANGAFDPALARNSLEEGVGHNSVIRLGDGFYAVYHARDVGPAPAAGSADRRTARICRLHVADGIIAAEGR